MPPAPAANPDAIMSTSRLFSVPPQKIFAAFENPALLAQWWGPDGFTSTFSQFEFKPGGKWVFTMHGPNGIDYPNECLFKELEPHTRIVIEHIVQPWFTLTVTLTPTGDRTHLAWTQEFETPEVAAKLRPLCTQANEQNLTRLHSLLSQTN